MQLSVTCIEWTQISCLEQRVQEGCHDSIEDARTALLLYRKYEELEKNGKFKETLVALYEVGRELQWKVPPGNN